MRVYHWSKQSESCFLPYWVVTVEVEDVGAGTGWSIEASEAAPAATAHSSEAASWLSSVCVQEEKESKARQEKKR